jgi:hypothetical protein
MGIGEQGVLAPTAHILPIVGMVVTTSPSFNLYRKVVLPEASKPPCGVSSIGIVSQIENPYDEDAYLAGGFCQHTRLLIHEQAHVVFVGWTMSDP